MTEHVIKTLSQNPPPSATIGDLNAKIAALETQLGLAHRPPSFNQERASAYVAELNKRVAALPRAKSIAPAAANIPALSTAPKFALGDSAPVTLLSREITAAEFTASISGPTMARSEFDKLNPAGKMAFVKSGGTFVKESPVLVEKTPRSERKSNSMWIQKFRHLSPAQQSNHCKSGGHVHE